MSEDLSSLIQRYTVPANTARSGLPFDAVPDDIVPDLIAAVREQIARDIEARQGVLGLDRASVRTAARIARGES